MWPVVPADVRPLLGVESVNEPGIRDLPFDLDGIGAGAGACGGGKRRDRRVIDW